VISLESFMQYVESKNPGEYEFYQAVHEVIGSLIPFLSEHPQYGKRNVLYRLVEPERIIIFRIPWMDDDNEIQINRGYRVEMNSAIGPYKGGLRFHAGVNLSIMKCLAFEQIFKNSLTTLPLGAGKGGADFNPKGKSENEVMRFCQSFMTELFRHIGENTDVPEGEIGVGEREIGYLFGQYKRLTNQFSGVLTGKSINWGGSLMRAEAPGYGIVFFAERMLNTAGQSMKDRMCTVSGSGNVARYIVEKIIQLGGKCISLSDSDGTVYDRAGIDEEKLSFIKELKNCKRGRIREYAEKYECKYLEGKKPWNIPCDIAFPAAIQNEITKQDAETLVENGCFCVCEGSDMSSTSDAIKVFQKSKILYAPCKASNAGGVAASGIEMAQNSGRLTWSREEVESWLHDILIHIHDSCVKYGLEKNGYINYVKGANIAGFVKVANAMIEQGVV
jgi:glutamate dehydrogenase (NADP+)